jgi:hypothetical protein
MKRLVSIALLVFVATFAQAQQRGQQPKKPATKKEQVVHLSAYVRDVALLYIETIERAVDAQTVSAGLSDDQFEVAKAISDRIEMHISTDADKDFYEFGLVSLTDRAKLRAHLAANGLALSGSRDPGAISKRDANDQSFTAAVKQYVRCNSELRTVVKAGEYKGYDSIIKACDPKLLEP